MIDDLKFGFKSIVGCIDAILLEIVTVLRLISVKRLTEVATATFSNVFFVLIAIVNCYSKLIAQVRWSG